MANVRTTIRSFVKTTLDAALSSANYDTYEHRIYALNATDKAVVDMGFQTVNMPGRDVMSYAAIHVASLFVRVTRTGNEAGMMDALEADEVLIAAAMHAADWSALLEEKPRLANIQYGDSGESGSVTASLTLQYELEYRINEADHETIIE